MFFYLDENDRMVDYDEVLLEPERKHVMCDHFAPSDLVRPKWDFTKEDWSEGVTQEELDEMANNQGKPESLEDIHDKLDEILDLLKKPQ